MKPEMTPDEIRAVMHDVLAAAVKGRTLPAQGLSELSLRADLGFSSLALASLYLKLHAQLDLDITAMKAGLKDIDTVGDLFERVCSIRSRS